MKKIIVLLLVSIVFVSSVSAELLAATNSIGPGLNVEKEKEKYSADVNKFTFGLGWAGNEFLGTVTKDGLGNPKNSYGLNNFLGFSYTWIYGAPKKEEINAAVDAVVKENGGTEKLRDYDLYMLTKQKMGSRSFTYFRLGTVYLLVPLIAQYGWMFPMGDVGRFQVGLGLPLLLNIGINFDF